MKQTIRQTILVLMTSLFFVACGDDGDDVIIERNQQPSGQTSADNANRNTTGPAVAQYRLEFPKVKGGASVVVVHRATLNQKIGLTGVNYCVEWDTNRNAQRWSCYQLYSTINYSSSNAANVSRYTASNDGTLSDDCQYPNDKDLPASHHWVEDPYKNSGYNHGHICPSADRLRATEANYQTFFITNMQPQFERFNAGIWSKMEEDVRAWANRSDTLYVCKGGTIDVESNILEYVFRSSHQSSRINAKYIPVPRCFFMALLSKKGNTWQAMGYWVDQSEPKQDSSNRSVYARTIDQLEELTGIDFFCNLSDDIEDEVERKLTNSYWF